MLGGADGSVELAHISQLGYAGMHFAVDRWMLLDLGDGLELAFTDGILQAHAPNGSSRIYFRLFRFVLSELGATDDVNRIRVPIARLQGMLDTKVPTLDAMSVGPVAHMITEFNPSPLAVRGRWLWLAQSFTSLAESKIWRTLHLSKWNCDEAVFVYRRG